MAQTTLITLNRSVLITGERHGGGGTRWVRAFLSLLSELLRVFQRKEGGQMEAALVSGTPYPEPTQVDYSWKRKGLKKGAR